MVPSRDPRRHGRHRDGRRVIAGEYFDIDAVFREIPESFLSVLPDRVDQEYQGDRNDAAGYDAAVRHLLGPGERQHAESLCRVVIDEIGVSAVVVRKDVFRRADDKIPARERHAAVFIF